jgi:hypothetical protein
MLDTVKLNVPDSEITSSSNMARLGLDTRLTYKYLVLGPKVPGDVSTIEAKVIDTTGQEYIFKFSDYPSRAGSGGTVLDEAALANCTSVERVGVPTSKLELLDLLSTRIQQLSINNVAKAQSDFRLNALPYLEERLNHQGKYEYNDGKGGTAVISRSENGSATVEIQNYSGIHPSDNVTVTRTVNVSFLPDYNTTIEYLYGLFESESLNAEQVRNKLIEFIKQSTDSTYHLWSPIAQQYLQAEVWRAFDFFVLRFMPTQAEPERDNLEQQIQPGNWSQEQLAQYRTWRIGHEQIASSELPLQTVEDIISLLDLSNLDYQVARKYFTEELHEDFDIEILAVLNNVSSQVKDCIRAVLSDVEDSPEYVVMAQQLQEQVNRQLRSKLRAVPELIKSVDRDRCERARLGNVEAILETAGSLRRADFAQRNLLTQVIAEGVGNQPTELAAREIISELVEAILPVVTLNPANFNGFHPEKVIRSALFTLDAVMQYLPSKSNEFKAAITQYYRELMQCQFEDSELLFEQSSELNRIVQGISTPLEPARILGKLANRDLIQLSSLSEN